ncbi:MAG: hypothetical protein IT529_00695 [Burkholderiales bacterium]|nr:hypothetical protein [Burkholderiales bacterium]
MRTRTGYVSIGVGAALLAAAAGVAMLFADGANVRAQTPPAPCVCSRSTPIVGADEVTIVPGQLQPRYGITHCQCGAATCVAQVAYGSMGIPQLACVK